MNNLPRLISISGAAGSGKDTVADYIQKLLDNRSHFWIKQRFSAELKEICGRLCGIAAGKFEQREYKDKVYPEWGMTGRQILQKVGSMFRNEFDKDTWIKLLFDDQPLDSNLQWIICDLRYKNEWEAVKQRGGICIRVDRPNLAGSDFHPSETEWRDLPFDYIIDNSKDLDHLRTQVQQMLDSYK